MEERLLLDRIELQRANIAMRYQQLSPAIEPHAADAVESVGDDAAVSACEATQFAVFEVFVKLPFNCESLEDAFKG